MADEKVTVDKQDVRTNYTNFTGNFIVAGTPEQKKLERSWVVNFSLTWSNYKGKDKYSDPFYIDAECFAYTEEDLQKVLASIQRKARIHVTKGIPRIDTWEKDGKKFSKFRLNVREWYPYHLDRNLDTKESTITKATIDTAYTKNTNDNTHEQTTPGNTSTPNIDDVL